MFGYSLSEVGNIFVMQGFSGLSLFSVLLLMALGLAIIFGQMGVINMAHGEFMAIGAYTTVLFSNIAVKFDFVQSYFVFAIIAAFIVAFIIGYLVEFVLIRHLYKRPLDTLLATWGLSLIMQQMFRSSFGAKEVSATLPEWLLGSFKPTPDIDIPINGVFVMVLAAIVTAGVFIFMFRSRWGLRMRATVQNRVMAGAVGINTKKVDRVTFARLRHCRCGRCSFHHYCVYRTHHRFAVHRGQFHGGGIRRRGQSARHDCFRFRHRSGAIHTSVLHDQLYGQGFHLADYRADTDDASGRFVCLEST
jgi:hypothetical protein